MPRTDALRFDKSPPAARRIQHAPNILLTSASGASRRQNVWSYIRVAGGDVLHLTTQSPRSRSRPRPHDHDHDHDRDHDHGHYDQHCRPMVTITQEGNLSAPQSNGLFQDIKFWLSMMVPGRNHLITCVTVCPFVPACPFPRADQQSCRQTEAKWCQLNGTQTCASWTMPGRQSPAPSITLCSCLTSCSSARQTRSNIGPPRTHARTKKQNRREMYSYSLIKDSIANAHFPPDDARTYLVDLTTAHSAKRLNSSTGRANTAKPLAKAVGDGSGAKRPRG